jgi:hypothetical protein
LKSAERLSTAVRPVVRRDRVCQLRKKVTLLRPVSTCPSGQKVANLASGPAAVAGTGNNSRQASFVVDGIALAND